MEDSESLTRSLVQLFSVSVKFEVVQLLLLSIFPTQCAELFKYATYDELFQSVLGICWEKSRYNLCSFHIHSTLRCIYVTLVRLIVKIVHEKEVHQAPIKKGKNLGHHSHLTPPCPLRLRFHATHPVRKNYIPSPTHYPIAFFYMCPLLVIQFRKYSTLFYRIVCTIK